MNRNFITFRFHDNDFCGAMLHAFVTLQDEFFDHLQNDDFDDIKVMIIRLMIGYQIAKHWSWKGQYKNENFIEEVQRYLKYFSNSSVSDSKADAMEPHNSEWCSIDLNLKKIWIH